VIHTVKFKYAAGDKVRLIGVDLPGTVLSALIDSEGPQYRVVWWWNGTRRSEWLHEFEIAPAAVAP
jgi:hypothetical protein